jgi:hypothetical protein
MGSRRVRGGLERRVRGRLKRVGARVNEGWRRVGNRMLRDRMAPKRAGTRILQDSMAPKRTATLILCVGPPGIHCVPHNTCAGPREPFRPTI